ncbi:MAG: Rpn family recombination-promoting nuclease/putative transposase [Oscillospiraceae bacterium]|nr:Rpn family recombination-promoting nuclease/putative transposase [Oscillospiraceae bacterium]
MIIISEKEQVNRHDEGYKSLFSMKENFLHFLKKYIGVSWADNISVDDMEKIDKSFITPEFKHIDSDIIYKLRFNNSDVYFYALLELQSSVDYTMPFRLLRYMVELLTDIFKNTDENERKRKNFKLPAIVPIILYNGTDSWNAVRQYKKYTENYNNFGNNIINFEYLLFDLNRKDKNFIKSTRKLVDLMFLLDGLRGEDTDYTQVPKLIAEYKNDLTGTDKTVLFGWVKHILIKGDMSPDLEEEFKQAFTEGDESTMTHAIERMRDDWLDKGIQTGRQEEKTELARRLLKRNRPIEEIIEDTGLSRREVESLQSH